MAALNQPWNPSQVFKLGTVSSAQGYQCVGYAPSKGRKCHNPIAIVNRQEAAKMLERLGRKDVMTADLDDYLEELASRLLCKRWHQNQAGTVSDRWTQDILSLRAEATRQRPEPIAAPLAPVIASFAQPQRPRSTAAAPSSAFGTLPQAPRTPALAPASAIIPPPQAPTPVAIPPAPARIDHPSASVAPQPQTHPATPSSPRAEPLAQPTPPATPTADRTDEECSICYEPVTTSNSSASSQCPHTFHTHCINDWFSTQDSETRDHSCPYCRTQWHPSNRRKVEGDCSVCQHALHSHDDDGGDRENEELVWCKSRCGQNFHSGCMATWCEVSAAEGRVGTCPDCRADWVL